jgi:uncharacterized protein YndB with AHSA1/START domain
MQHPPESHYPAGSDQLASFVVHREVDIAAILDVVWDIQVRVNDWPTWQPGIEYAALDETLSVGSQFYWTGGSLTLSATVDDLAEGERLVWRASDNVVAGVYEWTFEPSGRGTHVTATELLEHTQMVDDAAHSQAAIDEFLALWLANLKAEAEART